MTLIKRPSLQEHYVSLSFKTISGMGPNGAIIHYAPTPENCAKITKDNLFLLDSGAQYMYSRIQRIKLKL